MLLIVESHATNPPTSTPMELPEDEDVELLAQMIQVELSIPVDKQDISFNGKRVKSGSFRALGIVDGSTVIVKLAEKARISIHDIPGDVAPDQLLALVSENPQLLDQFLRHDPDLGKVLTDGDVGALRLFMMKRFMSKHKVVYEREKEMAAIESDPMNAENQRKIEEAIRQQNVQQNMDLAIENLPESFGRVTMLYVNIFVNDHPIKAFVDSGAQSTIMSQRCAERCGVMRLLDTRFAGEARGVGTARILGRVHIAQMKFGRSYFPISLTVLENNDVDFLFGLDMLRRYRCNIDLSRNVLRINIGDTTPGGTAESEEMPFLSDGDVFDAETGPALEAEDVGSSSASSSSVGVKAGGSQAPPAPPLGEEGGGGAMEIAPPPAPATEPPAAAAATALADSALEASAVDPMEGKIAQLEAFGFSRVEAIGALQQTGGDLDLAATLLMER